MRFDEYCLVGEAAGETVKSVLAPKIDALRSILAADPFNVDDLIPLLTETVSVVPTHRYEFLESQSTRLASPLYVFLCRNDDQLDLLINIFIRVGDSPREVQVRFLRGVFEDDYLVSGHASVTRQMVSLLVKHLDPNVYLPYFFVDQGRVVAREKVEFLFLVYKSSVKRGKRLPLAESGDDRYVCGYNLFMACAYEYVSCGSSFDDDDKEIVSDAMARFSLKEKLDFAQFVLDNFDVPLGKVQYIFDLLRVNHGSIDIYRALFELTDSSPRLRSSRIYQYLFSFAVLCLMVELDPSDMILKPDDLDLLIHLFESEQRLTVADHGIELFLQYKNIGLVNFLKWPDFFEVLFSKVNSKKSGFFCKKGGWALIPEGLDFVSSVGSPGFDRILDRYFTALQSVHGHEEWLQIQFFQLCHSSAFRMEPSREKILFFFNTLIKITSPVYRSSVFSTATGKDLNAFAMAFAFMYRQIDCFLGPMVGDEHLTTLLHKATQFIHTYSDAFDDHDLIRMLSSPYRGIPLSNLMYAGSRGDPYRFLEYTTRLLTRMYSESFKRAIQNYFSNNVHGVDDLIELCKKVGWLHVNLFIQRYKAVFSTYEDIKRFLIALQHSQPDRGDIPSLLLSILNHRVDLPIRFTGDFDFCWFLEHLEDVEVFKRALLCSLTVSSLTDAQIAGIANQLEAHDRRGRSLLKFLKDANFPRTIKASLQKGDFLHKLYIQDGLCACVFACAAHAPNLISIVSLFLHTSYRFSNFSRGLKRIVSRNARISQNKLQVYRFLAEYPMARVYSGASIPLFYESISEGLPAVREELLASYDGSLAAFRTAADNKFLYRLGNVSGLSEVEGSRLPDDMLPEVAIDGERYIRPGSWLEGERFTRLVRVLAWLDSHLDPASQRFSIMVTPNEGGLAASYLEGQHEPAAFKRLEWYIELFAFKVSERLHAGDELAISNVELDHLNVCLRGLEHNYYELCISVSRSSHMFVAQYLKQAIYEGCAFISGLSAVETGHDPYDVHQPWVEAAAWLGWFPEALGKDVYSHLSPFYHHGAMAEIAVDHLSIDALSLQFMQDYQPDGEINQIDFSSAGFYPWFGRVYDLFDTNKIIPAEVVLGVKQQVISKYVALGLGSEMAAESFATDEMTLRVGLLSQISIGEYVSDRVIEMLASIWSGDDAPPVIDINRDRVNDVLTYAGRSLLAADKVVATKEEQAKAENDIWNLLCMTPSSVSLRDPLYKRLVKSIEMPALLKSVFEAHCEELDKVNLETLTHVSEGQPAQQNSLLSRLLCNPYYMSWMLGKKITFNHLGLPPLDSDSDDSDDFGQYTLDIDDTEYTPAAEILRRLSDQQSFHVLNEQLFFQAGSIYYYLTLLKTGDQPGHPELADAVVEFFGLKKLADFSCLFDALDNIISDPSASEELKTSAVSFIEARLNQQTELQLWDCYWRTRLIAKTRQASRKWAPTPIPWRELADNAKNYGLHDPRAMTEFLRTVLMLEEDPVTKILRLARACCADSAFQSALLEAMSTFPDDINGPFLERYYESIAPASVGSSPGF